MAYLLGLVDPGYSGIDTGHSRSSRIDLVHFPSPDDDRPADGRGSDDRSGFASDQAATVVATADLPIPEVVEVGDVPGGPFAISVRRHGAFALPNPGRRRPHRRVALRSLARLRRCSSSLWLPLWSESSGVSRSGSPSPPKCCPLRHGSGTADGPKACGDRIRSGPRRRRQGSLIVPSRFSIYLRMCHQSLDCTIRAGSPSNTAIDQGFSPWQFGWRWCDSLGKGPGRRSPRRAPRSRAAGCLAASIGRSLWGLRRAGLDIQRNRDGDGGS